MLAGDFVYCIVSDRNTPVTLSVDTTGGQTWTSESAVASGSQTTRAFWCTFNGTWAVDPKFVTSSLSTNKFSVVMLVFRPSGTPTWAVDVAQASGNATPGTPFDVTATGQTAVDLSTVTIATWANTDFDGNTFALQTAGWSNPDSVAQWRNATGTSQDITLSVAYKINTSSGATGNVTNRMDSSVTTFWLIETFKDQSVATGQPAGSRGRGVPGMRLGGQRFGRGW